MILPPEPSKSVLLKNGTMSDPFRRWTVEISDMSLLMGEGTPEASVVAVQGREYMDTLGTAGAIKYIKRDADVLGDRSKGWILI